MGTGLRIPMAAPSTRGAHVTKLRKNAGAIALAGLLALFGTACTRSGPTSPSEPAGGASEPAAESSEAAS